MLVVGCHCEECSDEAIQRCGGKQFRRCKKALLYGWIATAYGFAMTSRLVIARSVATKQSRGAAGSNSDVVKGHCHAGYVVCDE